MPYRQHFSTRQTLPPEAIPGRQMVKNNAGGFTFEVTDWERLERFLILGSEGGTYYVKEKPLTVDNAQAVLRCIQADGLRVVKRIVAISDGGRAPKNDAALFALAMCTGLGDQETRRAAFDSLARVVRIGTHLFHFLEYVEGFRGWGRSLRRGVGGWYNAMPLDKLAYQVIKYQQRDGWRHRDALRLAHPNPEQGDNWPQRGNLYHWLVDGESSRDSLLPPLVRAFEAVTQAEERSEVIRLITDYKLTREMIPTRWLNDRRVWGALLPGMPLTALIRNLGKMTALELLQPLSNEVGLIVQKLTDRAYIKRSRLHPLSILVALRVYATGQGLRGSLVWEPVTQIINALDDAFYLAFDNVEPTGKRTLLALDVSGSMGWSNIAGLPITPREATGALALVTARIEPQHMITAFSHELLPVTLSPQQRLDDVIAQLRNIRMGGTDCALPMIYALRRRIKIDTFIIYTDNETWAGWGHPIQALRQYREQMNIPAKLIVVGMTATKFSIADPDDSGMLDVVGFDTGTPQMITNFSRDS